MTLTQRIKDRARQAGFDLVGVCPAISPQGIHQFYDWLSCGYAGEMSYLVDRADAYRDPAHVLDGVRSLVMLAIGYRTESLPVPEAGDGVVSSYAWGAADYHDVIRDRLRPLADWLRQAVPGARSRGVVDTAPLLEREFAQLAGLGWRAKNTLLIHPRLGSWIFLAAILTDAILDYDQPFVGDRCGTCHACLDVCPTDALVQPYVLDASRCISYLTIELRGAIPVDRRTELSDWTFGCDLCQLVCPWNNRAPRSSVSEFEPRHDLRPLALEDLFAWDEDTFQTTFRRTPLWRAKRRGLLRNAAIVLGNQRAATSLRPLTLGLHDNEPLVRGASAWALGQLGGSAAVQLSQRTAIETDQCVQREILAALKNCE